MNYPSRKFIKPTNRHLKEFADYKLANEKYNELLSLATTQSILFIWINHLIKKDIGR